MTQGFLKGCCILAQKEDNHKNDVPTSALFLTTTICSTTSPRPYANTGASLNAVLDHYNYYTYQGGGRQLKAFSCVTHRLTVTRVRELNASDTQKLTVCMMHRLVNSPFVEVTQG